MKKSIALLFFVLSTSAFATESVIEAMRSMFHPGIYFGFAPSNESCVLEVIYEGDAAHVTATLGNKSVSRTITDGTGFRFHPGKRELLSSDHTGTFRTLAANGFRTYTVTAERPEGEREKFVECIINTFE